MAPIKKSTIFLGVAVLAGLVAAVKFLMPSKTEPEPEMTTAKTEPSKSAVLIAPVAANKEAREISVNASYGNPSGKDDVKFSIFVDAAGTIVDAKVGVLAVNEISKKRQVAFADGLPMAVKGKKLSELVSIDKVGGSSLTTKAFNDSLAELKSAL